MNIQELIPAYTGLPAPLSKSQGVHLIVMGRLHGGCNYFRRESASGKGNKARRRANNLAAHFLA